MKHESDPLESLYQESKQDKLRHYDLKASRHKVILAAKRQALTRATRINLKPLSMIGVAALCLLVLFIGHLPSPNPTASGITVTLHRLAEDEQSLTAHHQLAYAQINTQALAQRDLFAAHQQRQLRLASQNDSWRMLSCDDEVIELSANLVAQLRQVNRLPQSLRVGDPVNVSFDASGRILSVEKSAPLRC